MRRLLIGGSPFQGRYPASEVNDGGCPEKPDHLRLGPYPDPINLGGPFGPQVGGGIALAQVLAVSKRLDPANQLKVHHLGTPQHFVNGAAMSVADLDRMSRISARGCVVILDGASRRRDPPKHAQ